ncbi:MAG TPA: twin-arginine translocation signal domain-containing protein, partial [Sedimentisphaerales bacterium]|nr:twin-arginine translocation signal domain-containing protein [Sedimentisphaerales bacterium]
MTTSIGASKVNRREFLKHSGSVAAGAAVLGSLTPNLHAAADDTIRLALIGCGGRGTGAVGDALSVPN